MTYNNIYYNSLFDSIAWWSLGHSTTGRDGLLLKESIAMPTSSPGRKPKKRRRSSTAAVTTDASSQALRTLIADRFGGKFSALAAAITDGSDAKSLRARIWRAQSAKRPSALEPGLAQAIVRVARPKSVAAKKAVKLIRKVAKGTPVVKKTTKTKDAAVPLLLDELLQAPRVVILRGGKELFSQLLAADLVKRSEDGFVLAVPIDAETALHLLLPE